MCWNMLSTCVPSLVIKWLTLLDIFCSVIGPFSVQKPETGAAIMIFFFMMILIKQQYEVVLKYKSLKNFIKKWRF